MGRSHRRRTPSPDTVAREAKVVQLRRSKLDWTTIADQVGVNSPQAAQRIYRRALERVPAAQVEELRREDTDMLDRLHAAFWRDAMAGDVNAGQLVLKIFEQRAKLLGTYAPVKQQVEVTDNTRQRITELIDKIRALPPTEDELRRKREARVIEGSIENAELPVAVGYAGDAHALPAGTSKHNASNPIPG
jgi:hypothetical protein